VAKIESFAKAERRLRATLGGNVRTLRLSLGMTQADLAEEVETRRSQISEIERAKANPTLDSVARIAAALGVEPAALFARGRR
jgi:transcriptional regulator with XRE-family HTH domain